MTLAEGIRKHGFRTWYERQLLQSHAHLALAFLCLIGLFTSFEALTRFHSLGDQAIDLLAAALCIGGGLWALRRYLFLLSYAEATARQADCPHCQAYGRLELLQSDATGGQVRVRCRGCGHPWHMGV